MAVVQRVSSARVASEGGGSSVRSPPAEAEPLYEALVAALRELGVPTRTGRFGADRELELVNDGPVTFVREERSPPSS